MEYFLNIKTYRGRNPLLWFLNFNSAHADTTIVSAELECFGGHKTG